MTVPGTYSPPVADPALDLDLSRNEGRADAVALFSALPELGPLVSRYPDTTALRRRLAELNEVEPDQVLVTAGGDDALHRCFLALVGSGGRAVTTTPTFEMIPVYAGQVGARLTEVPWLSGPFPAAAVPLRSPLPPPPSWSRPTTRPVPCSPVDDLERVAAAAPHVVLDAAYGEFADTDLSPVALGLGNTVMVRTLSKAYGLAGLRVGYLLGPPELVARIGAQGGPYPVAALSAAIAEARLGLPREALDGFVAEVRAERHELMGVLERLGTTPLPSQANFVLTRCPDAAAGDPTSPVHGSRPARLRRPPGDGGHGADHPPRRPHRLRPAGGGAREGLGPPERTKPMTRTATVTRRTSEVEVTVQLDLDGDGRAVVATGLGFLDHMLDSLARHGRLDLEVRATGDLAVDDHHTVEDCAIALGRAIDEALGDRSGITRFGHAYAPLDESLARAVVDLSGRPWPEVAIPFTREMLGEVAGENLVHFLRSLAIEGRMALHVDLIRGDNDHHKAEAAFKAVALALRAAVSVTGSGIQSTKGTLQ